MMKYSYSILNLSHIMQNHKTTGDFLPCVDSTLVHQKKKSWESLSVIWKMEIFSRLSAKSTQPNPLHSQLWRSPHIQFYYKMVSPLCIITIPSYLSCLMFTLFLEAVQSRVVVVGERFLSNFHSACFSMWFSSHSEVKRVKQKSRSLK